MSQLHATGETELFVTLANDEAVRLYRSLGFALSKLLPKLVDMRPLFRDDLKAGEIPNAELELEHERAPDVPVPIA